MTPTPNEIETAVKLLPCPFCGGEAKLGELLDNHWYVLCQRCETLSSDHFDHKGGAIGAWNTRMAASARRVADGSGPKVHHLGAALQGIADQHSDVLTPRQTKALYLAAEKLWEDAPSSPAAPEVEPRESWDGSGEVERYAALGETSIEGPRWYIWKSGHGGNYVGGKIASWDSASAIADELNRLAALAIKGGGEQ